MAVEEEEGEEEVAALLHNYLNMVEQGSVRDSGIMGSSDSGSNCSSLSPLSPWERLVRTHGIWFLPSLTEEEATSILHSKEPGNFLVRRSLTTHSCLSVKLGLSHGYVVHHYNIKESHSRMALEGSNLTFDNILSLVHHYQHLAGELPVLLSLPEILRETEGRHHLTSLARLARDFWHYPMSQPGRRSQLIFSSPNEPGMAQHHIGGGPMTKPVGGPGWQGANKPGSLEERLPELRRPPSLSLSPLRARRRSVVSVLTVAPACHPAAGPQRHSVSGVREMKDDHLMEESCEVRAITEKVAESVLYFKSTTEDKMSDYEDIWERTPGPESEGLAISPTQSEMRFRQYLISKFSAGGEDHCNSPSPVPSIISSSASPISSSPSSNSSTIESDFSSTEEEEEDVEDTESPEPLAALEVLTEMSADDEKDLVEQFCCTQPVEVSEGGEDEVNPEGVKEIRESVERGRSVRNESVERGRSSVREFERDRVSSVRETLERTESSDESEEESKVGIILRKLSLRRTSSSRKSSSKKRTDRLSDVIGCYLGRRGPSCQVDSSSWEFLDQNVCTSSPNARAEDEDPLQRQIRLNSEAADILARGGKDATREGSSSCSSGDSGMYHTDPGMYHTTDSGMYHTDFSSNLTNTTGNSSAGDVDHSSSPESVSKEKLRETSEDDALETSQDLVQTNFQNKIWNSSQDHVNPPSLSRGSAGSSHVELKQYLLELANQPDSLFGRTVTQFVACTRESSVTEPCVVMRNMRQVMNGLKNYTVNSGEGEVARLIQRERECLRPDQFFDVDMVLEEVMQTLIILPLKDHLKKVFLEDFTSSGSLQLVAENINFSLSLSASEFRVPSDFVPRLRDTTDLCRRNFTSMASLYSPSAKLDLLLSTMSSLLSSSTASLVPVSVPSFCSLLAYLVVHTGVETLEVEAEWMWGLLHPSLLAGQGGHYLSLLSSSLHLIKNVRALLGSQGPPASPLISPTLSVLVPDGHSGSLYHCHVPLRSHMVARDVSRYIAQHMNIHNPEDFALFRITERKDCILAEDTSLHKIQEGGEGLSLVYRRIDSNVLLPLPSPLPL